ncbi:MAG: hypothetical protein IOC86_13930 [Aestuariivirga sp.]|nr:hypothetical protein [Aestuariivirga sp.]
MSIEEAHKLLTLRDELIETSGALRSKAYRLLELHHGLESGVTQVRDEAEGYVGTYQQILNYFPGKLPWLLVHFDPPLPGYWGHERKYYGRWSVVLPEQGKA